MTEEEIKIELQKMKEQIELLSKVVMQYVYEEKLINRR